MIRLEYESGGIKKYDNRDMDWALQEFILDSHIERMIFTLPSDREIILRKYVKDEMIRYEILDKGQIKLKLWNIKKISM